MTETEYADEFVDTDQAAALLGLTAVTLRTRRARGREPVPSYKHGSAVSYRLSEIQAHLSRNA